MVCAAGHTMGRWMLILYVALGLLATFTTIGGCTNGSNVGINYGMLGDNLPSPDQVISLVKSKGITNLRLFHPDSAALTALKNSGISVVLGTLNEDLQRLAADTSFAASWVSTNVAAYHPSVTFRYITAGNEVIPGDLAASVLPAMQNLRSALESAGIDVPVTTAISTQVLGVSYPPSQAAFSEASTATMTSIVSFLDRTLTPLLVNVYPYFAYAANQQDVRLDYALFTAQEVVVRDGTLEYTNLFDAIVDAVYSALEKAGGKGVDVVVTETGWPSGGGGVGSTVENARTYNNNMVKHAKGGGGTPKKPGKGVVTYLFAMFNEDKKPEGIEQNFGLYRPDMTEVYPVEFS